MKLRCTWKAACTDAAAGAAPQNHSKIFTPPRHEHARRSAETVQKVAHIRLLTHDALLAYRQAAVMATCRRVFIQIIGFRGS